MAEMTQKEMKRSNTQMLQLQQQLEFSMKASHREQNFALCYLGQHDKLVRRRTQKNIRTIHSAAILVQFKAVKRGSRGLSGQQSVLSSSQPGFESRCLLLSAMRGGCLPLPSRFFFSLKLLSVNYNFNQHTSRRDTLL